MEMIRTDVRDHVAEVIIDNPPVNALPVAGWFELASSIRTLGADPDVRALIVAGNPELRASTSRSSPPIRRSRR
jgi:enoyl-CoA hydratase/carnithine racemase